MKQTIIALGLCALLAWGVWRTPASDPDTITHREFFALGTLVQVSFADPIPAELMPRIQTQLQNFEQRWSVLGDGALAQINQQLMAHNSAALPEDLRAGFGAAQQACKDSQGLFDPGIGSLVQLWGFDDEANFRDQPPPAATISAAQQQRSRLCDAKLGDRLEVATPGAHFDFGASAKGRAVDEIIQLLQAEGINNAIVNAGGDLKAIGRRPDRSWRIGIRHPRPEAGKEILASLAVNDGEAVFSSGDYERYFVFEDQRYHHIIDPRNGYPATSSQSATIVHNSAELADAAATALFVAGPELAASAMKSMHVDLWMLVDSQGVMLASDAMRERLNESL